MKAAIQTAYGPAEVLHIQSIEKPIPQENEILVRIQASSVTTADTMMRKGEPRYGRLFLGVFKPRIPVSGTGFSGVIESLGEKVTGYRIGQSVFGESVLGAGTNTEYVCVAEDGVLLEKPDSMSHAEAAPVCDGAVTSLYLMKHMGNIENGCKVLINGAAGSLGSAAVQIAHHFGAEVTAVCSRRNFEVVSALGADHLIDYHDTDVTEQRNTFDMIYDCVGKLSYMKARRILNREGTFVSPVLSLPLMFFVLASKLNVMGSKPALFSATGLLPANIRRTILAEVCKLVNAKELITVIDRQFQLLDIVDAHRYLDSGQKRANVVLVVEP